MRQVSFAVVLATSFVAGTSLASPSAAHAGDFFSSFFGGLIGAPVTPPPPPVSPSFPGDPGADQSVQPRSRRSGMAYCVRSCDGRYFPLAASQDRTEACRSFCPASETNVVFGSSIDNAVTESGKPYSELPNAFRYRTQLVAGCTCNGKDVGGLAKISIENDPTIRKGDFISGPNGLTVTNGKGASSNDKPATNLAGRRFTRLPVVAAQ